MQVPPPLRRQARTRMQGHASGARFLLRAGEWTAARPRPRPHIAPITPVAFPVHGVDGRPRPHARRAAEASSSPCGPVWVKPAGRALQVPRGRGGTGGQGFRFRRKSGVQILRPLLPDQGAPQGLQLEIRDSFPSILPWKLHETLSDGPQREFQIKCRGGSPSSDCLSASASSKSKSICAGFGRARCPSPISRGFTQARRQRAIDARP